MERKIGFETGCAAQNADVSVAGKQPDPQPPVRCVAYVRFPGVHKAYAYYNDRFCLQEGDVVFVSGKLAGKAGVVDDVQTHFKIRLSDYERVIAKAEGAIHGSFKAVLDKMVCTDAAALPPEMFRTWVLPPVEDPEDILLGEGFRVELNAFGSDKQMPHKAMEKGLELCRERRVVYLHLEGGKGTAFIEGGEWREVNFTLSNGTVSDLYCDCPYPENGMCKHMAAVLLTLRTLLHTDELEHADRFVALDDAYFWTKISGRTQIDI